MDATAEAGGEQRGTVFVANRGEIAARILRTARAMGYRTAVMYVPSDAGAPYVRQSDVALPVSVGEGGNPFLDIATVVDCAREAQATLLHPGYGFLSEDPDFADAVVAAGIGWVGPPSSAIRLLANKVAAREIAKRVGAPLAAGSEEPVEDAAEILSFAEQVGYPVIIKAANGGGGRGMRIVRSADEAAHALDSARREAVTAFGDGSCFVEKFLERPRHIETQCLVDDHGNVAVVGTRDCSVQRRHQKVIEEAPAPGLSAEQLATLTEASRRIMQETGYRGAGTCEFLLSRDGTITFLEVNTRLQVEHTVTEEVARLDLVELQFRIARGEPVQVPDHAGSGSAIEFRINSEDPGAGFFPSLGVIEAYAEPSGPGIRVDSGVAEGSEITPLFDSLMAKLIVRGETREEAIARSLRALDDFRIGGVETSIVLYRAVLGSTEFLEHGASADGSVYTDWLESEFLPAQQLPPSSPDEPEPDALRLAVHIDGEPRVLALPSWAAAALGGAAGLLAAPLVVGLNTRQGAEAEELRGVHVAPAQAVLTKLLVELGDQVEAGDPLAVLEVMKMEHSVRSEISGVVAEIYRSIGDLVRRNDSLVRIA